MHSPRYFLTLLALAAILLTAGAATAADLLAYYPFDEVNLFLKTTPDDVSDNDLTVGEKNGTEPPTVTSGMFDNAITSTVVTGYAELADGDLDFDTDYTQLSVSLWVKTDTWEGDTFGERYLTGKYATGDERGWKLVIAGGETHQIGFGGFETNLAASPNLVMQTDMSSPLDADAFHNIVATFDANGATTETQFAIYVDGIRQQGLISLSKQDPPPETLSKITGDNANNFQVFNRGATASNPSSGGGLIGSIDDYVVATGDVLTDQQVALIHGLGNLAGVDYGSGATPGAELAAVLDAYDTQGSAVAGSETWSYSANVGGGTTVGAIGGSVAGGYAYIVLGADGSGVTTGTAQAIPGDTDGDNDVDADDAAILAVNWGRTNIDGGASVGDFNDDKAVNVADAAILAANWTESTSEGAAAPEPSTAAALLLMAGVAAFTRGRKQ